MSLSNTNTTKQRELKERNEAKIKLGQKMLNVRK